MGHPTQAEKPKTTPPNLSLFRFQPSHCTSEGPSRRPELPEEGVCAHPAAVHCSTTEPANGQKKSMCMRKTADNHLEGNRTFLPAGAAHSIICICKAWNRERELETPGYVAGECALQMKRTTYSGVFGYATAFVALALRNGTGRWTPTVECFNA